MGIATVDTHRTLKNKEKTSLSVSLVRHSIDSFTFVAINMFIVQGLQYLILHFDFP